MDSDEPFYKEVYVSRSTGSWKEIFINTGGIQSTLQDIATEPRSGGYAYENQSNRFIYWRTAHDVLELVEESLDFNLFNNQIRYTFTESRILEWVSIVETHNSVVVLVPTLCSLHRLTFPHPHLLNKKGNRSGTAYSIFHGASEAEAMNPSTYHLLNSIPCDIVSGACCLGKSDEAIFALSLKNAHIMLISMEYGTGNVTSTTFSRSSMVPRFIYDISSVLTGKEVMSRYISTSLVLHCMNESYYLFTLDAGGEIRAWSCESGTSVSIQVFKPSDSNRNNSKLRKGISEEGDLLLCAYYQNEIALVRVIDSNTGIQFFLHSSPVLTSKSQSLVDMMVGEKCEVWCSWTTGHDAPMVSRLDMSLSSDDSDDVWKQVILAKPTIFEYPSDVVLDPAQLYLDKIMNCGFSSTPDLARTLLALKSDRKIVTNYDLRKQISVIVDSEISAETTDLEMDDTDFLIVSERIWNRLYRCCVQYLSTGLQVSGLIRLPSSNCLVLIKPHGYSLARHLTPLEIVSYIPYNALPPHVSTPLYSKLIEAVKEKDVASVTDKLELALHLGDYLDDKLMKECSVGLTFQNFDKVASLDEALYVLIKELHAPDDISKFEDSEGLCSDAGMSAVCMLFHELTSIRLKTCECICIVLSSRESGFNQNYVQLFKEMTTVYKVLVWICQNPVVGHPSILHSFVSSHPRLGRDNLLDTVQVLLHTLWPINSSEVLANHLLDLKRYDLLQMYAHFVDYTSWRLILAQSYLATGEPHKAYNLVALDNQEMCFYLKAISLFELYSYPDYVIAMVDSNLALDNVSPADVDTLYSLKFNVELKLGHYKSAYSCIELLPNYNKKADFLLKLVLELINCQRFDVLTSLSFCGLEDQLEKILVSRSRSLEFSKSQVFYTLLYSLHINNKAYKKAASVMYEQALRCESSEAQWKCFSISYNALSLLKRDDAFIVKPNFFVSSHPSVEIVDAEEMRKELELAKYRFYLKSSPCDTVGELLSSCVAEKLYSKAIRLASLFSLDSSLIVEAFTADVLHLADPSSDYKWLTHNDDDHIEHTINSSNVRKVGWRLLEYTVNKYEKPCETFLHKAIASQVLRMKFHLPIWLINSYKRKNCGELLRVYLRFGDLESANDLAVDYLKAAMGVSCQDFGFTTGIQPSSPAIYTPLYTIDLLLKQLKANKLGEDLQYTLNEYIEAAKRVTSDKILSARNIM